MCVRTEKIFEIFFIMETVVKNDSKGESIDFTIKYYTILTVYIT